MLRVNSYIMDTFKTSGQIYVTVSTYTHTHTAGGDGPAGNWDLCAGRDGH